MREATAARAVATYVVRSVGGFVAIVKGALQSLRRARAQDAAASIAYYSLFSFFPLLLSLVAVGSFLLESQRAYDLVVETVTRALPTSRSLIEDNVQNVLDKRGAVGIVGLVGLLWSATRAFMAIAVHVNRAWTGAEPRGTLERRLVALGMVGTLAGLLLLSLLVTTAFRLLPRWEIPILDALSAYEKAVWRLVSELVPWLIAFLVFLALYRWVPSVQVKWSAALWGAVIAASAWEVAKIGFAWYVSSGLVRYDLVYGSLGTVVALMLWIYVSSWIALFGAHVSAAVAGSPADGKGRER
jgi:membrane protein